MLTFCGIAIVVAGFVAGTNVPRPPLLAPVRETLLLAVTAAIGLPLAVHRFGGDPAIVCAPGMLSGFCDTLSMPMAANFNVVPPARLKLSDRNGVIRVQVPTALILLLGNIMLMHLLAFSR